MGVETQLDVEGLGNGAEFDRAPGPYVRTGTGPGSFVLVPNVEVGRGSNQFETYVTLRASGEARYHIPVDDKGMFEVYPLAGVTVYHWRDTDCPAAGTFACNETNPGLLVGGGIEINNRVGFNASVSAVGNDIPDAFFVLSVLFCQ